MSHDSFICVVLDSLINKFAVAALKIGSFVDRMALWWKNGLFCQFCGYLLLNKFAVATLKITALVCNTLLQQKHRRNMDCSKITLCNTLLKQKLCLLQHTVSENILQCC